MGKKTKPAFYAVARGLKPGLYHDWETCKAQVHGVRDSRCRGFSTKEAALAFITEHSDSQAYARAVGATHSEENHCTAAPLKDQNVIRKRPADSVPTSGEPLVLDPRPEKRIKSEHHLEREHHLEPVRQKTSTPVVHAGTDPCEAGFTVVYTDGSSVGNGTDSATAGIGVYFGPADPRNLSERLAGKQTNNRAELTAVIRALEMVPSTVNIMIKTDSQYSINCFTLWHQSWERNGWRNSKKQDVENKDLVQEGLRLMRERSGKIRLVKVQAHVGILGNEIADRLANEGALKP